MLTAGHSSDPHPSASRVDRAGIEGEPLLQRRLEIVMQPRPWPGTLPPRLRPRPASRTAQVAHRAVQRSARKSRPALQPCRGTDYELSKPSPSSSNSAKSGASATQIEARREGATASPTCTSDDAIWPTAGRIACGMARSTIRGERPTRRSAAVCGTGPQARGEIMSGGRRASV